MFLGVLIALDLHDLHDLDDFLLQEGPETGGTSILLKNYCQSQTKFVASCFCCSFFSCSFSLIWL